MLLSGWFARILVTVLIGSMEANIVSVRRQTSEANSQIVRFDSQDGKGATEKVSETEPSLRQWLVQQDYHLAMAPMIGTNNLLLGLLGRLEAEGLSGRLLKSMSGVSNGAVCSAIWGTRLSKGANEYVKVWGRLAERRSENASQAELYYSRYMDGPVYSETDSLASYKDELEALVRDISFYNFKFSKPTFAATLGHNAYWEYWMKLMKIPQDFKDIALPVIVTTYDRPKATGLFVMEGDVHSAVIGSASPHSVSQGIPSGGWIFGDGYPADNLGVKGYDSLVGVPPEKVLKLATYDKIFPSTRILNIVPMDSIGQVQCGTNWTKELKTNHLNQVAQFFLDVGQPFFLHTARRLHRQGLPYIKERDLLENGHKTMRAALDQKMSLKTELMKNPKDVKNFCLVRSLHLGGIGEVGGSIKVFNKLYSEFRKHSYDLPVHHYATIKAERSPQLRLSLRMQKCMFAATDFTFRLIYNNDDLYFHPRECMALRAKSEPVHQYVDAVISKLGSESDDNSDVSKLSFNILKKYWLHSSKNPNQPAELDRPQKKMKLTKSMINMQQHPNAKCNDGSPAAFYYGAADAEHQKKWHIHLEGGNWCYDQKSCMGRLLTAAKQTGSQYWPAQEDLGGIFEQSSSNPVNGWHHVYVKHCTSDGHMGNAEKNWIPSYKKGKVIKRPFAFEGQAVVEAVFKELRKKGLGSESHQEVLMTGCSAGASGVMAHLDRVPSYVDSQHASTLTVKGLLDAPLWNMPLPAANDPEKVSVSHQQRLAAKLHNPIGYDECKSASPEDPERCLMSDVRIKHVSTPHIASNTLWDWWNAYNQMSVGFLPYSDKQMQWLKDAAGKIRQVMTSEPFGIGKSIKFSSSCHEHCLTQDDLFTSIKVKHKDATAWSLQDTLSCFLNPNCKALEKTQLVDECTSFNCGCQHQTFKNSLETYIQKAWQKSVSTIASKM
eukprot:gnl/MRDRNA2_/MRDRNA2_104849_c0_seq1.p1 gnl/MRDRNA2_/MRDRNA2_104849_c0~~gnl/MRDRNA2_/MRDRNA2_104849_c0_seq1.p1  ORF type:complete len:945 (+),score=161.57 gnl/MRDRNA2_/MRDRNA2_104849_c0_seq1:151-2985(+)